MARTRLRFEMCGSIESPQVSVCPYAPKVLDDEKRFLPLDCDVSGPPFDSLGPRSAETPRAAVRLVGQEVYARLAAHPGVKRVLEQIAAAGPNEPCPIYLELATDDAEALPFETLFAQDRFLALDDRSPIVRVAVLQEPDESTILRPYELPLRVTAIISAEGRGVYEETEWQALYNSLRAARFGFRLQVFVGREALRDIILEPGDGRIEVRLIDDSQTMLDEIGEFGPAVLHVFCHGITSPTVYLEVASRATHAMGDDPLYVGRDHIRRINKSLWLLTLNTCAGAEPLDDAYSLALAIANDGVPAVVGMREAIDAADANTFTAAFYPALVRELERILGQPHEEPPDWPKLMRAPRERLCGWLGGPPLETAAEDKRWTLPVLYVRKESLRLRQVARQELWGELEGLRKARTSIHPGTPADLLTEIDRRIAELEQALRPGP